MDADTCAYTAEASLPQPHSARGCGIMSYRKREYSHFVTPSAQNTLFADFFHDRTFKKSDVDNKGTI
jgi:hypothetical protein